MTQHRSTEHQRATSGPASRWLHLHTQWAKEVEPFLVLGREGLDPDAPGRCVEVLDSEVRKGGLDRTGNPSFNFYPIKWRQAYRASFVLSRLLDPSEDYTKIFGQTWVLHRVCNNPLCVNPEHIHLRPRTWVNVKNAERRKHYGTPMPANYDVDTNRRILALYDQGLSVAKISAKLGVPSNAVSYTLRTWIDPDKLLSMTRHRTHPEVRYPIFDSELRTMAAPLTMQRIAETELVSKSPRRRTRKLLNRPKPGGTS